VGLFTRWNTLRDLPCLGVNHADISVLRIEDKNGIGGVRLQAAKNESKSKS